MIWDDYVEIGFIAKAHGIKGEVKASMDVYDIEEYRDKKTLWLAKAPGNPIPYTVEKFQPGQKHTILAFKDVDDRNQAEALMGHTLLIPQAELPELAPDQFYFYEILGFTVVDDHYGSLGKVDDVWESGPQALVRMVYKEKEVLIPAVKAVLYAIDREKEEVYTRLPKDLLETYMA